MDRRQVLFLPALAASCSRGASVTVGAKNFTEQDILGEILTQHLARTPGLTPRARLHLGGSLIAHQSLLDGSLDLYPEYSGTALTSCLKLPLSRDPEEVFNLVRRTYLERHNVEWGWRLGFSNTFAMVMRRPDSSTLNIRTLSDAATRKTDWRIGVGYEFEQRPDGWPSFRQAYPLQTSGNLRTMDLGLLYRALDAGEVDLVAGNSTDAALADNRFIALEDDKRFFPPYECCLAVRRAALEAHPALRSALDKLAGRISVPAMRIWNAEATIKATPPATIAANFVRSFT